jgi:hypothetical protein
MMKLSLIQKLWTNPFFFNWLWFFFFIQHSSLLIVLYSPCFVCLVSLALIVHFRFCSCHSLKWSWVTNLGSSKGVVSFSSLSPVIIGHMSWLFKRTYTHLLCQLNFKHSNTEFWEMPDLPCQQINLDAAIQATFSLYRFNYCIVFKLCQYFHNLMSPFFLSELKLLLFTTFYHQEPHVV